MLKRRLTTEWKVFSMNEMHVEPPFLCDYVKKQLLQACNDINSWK